MGNQSVSGEEKRAAIKRYLEEDEIDIETYKDDGIKLSTLRRERLYFLLALMFGLVFNLCASAIDNLIQMYGAHEQPDPLYFTYATIIIALSFTMAVWMIGKIRDFDIYIALTNKDRSRQPKSQSKSRDIHK